MFATSDLHLAAWLRLKGFKLSRTEKGTRKEARRISIFFQEDDVLVKAAASEYYQGAVCSALDLANQHRAIREMIRVSPQLSHGAMANWEDVKTP